MLNPINVQYSCVDRGGWMCFVDAIMIEQRDSVVAESIAMVVLFWRRRNMVATILR
jgi:hypothetical protein